MPIQYMTTSGIWTCSCQSEEDKPSPDLVEAPADSNGFYGCEGTQWNGTEWIPYLPPPDSCTALQGRRALGMERVQHISTLIDHLDLLRPDLSAEEIWEIKTAWEYGGSWYRLGREVNLLREIYGMTEEERDDLMRLANTY